MVLYGYKPHAARRAEVQYKDLVSHRDRHYSHSILVPLGDDGNIRNQAPLCSLLSALLFDCLIMVSVPITPITPDTRLQVDSLLETLSIAQSPVNTLNSAGSVHSCSLGDTVPYRSFHLPTSTFLSVDLFFLFGFTSSPSPLPLPSHLHLHLSEAAMLHQSISIGLEVALTTTTTTTTTSHY